MSALRTPSLFELVREAQQNDLMINREVERWNELTNLPRRNACEERYVQEHRLDDHGFWKQHPENQGWSLRVPSDLVQQVLWENHDSTLA